MDLAAFRRLLAAPAALAAAVELRPSDATRLAALEALRRHFPADLAAAAVETALLRLKAAGKFAHAARMYFTRDGLEVASGERVANHRAQRLRRYETVGDFGCGVGGDTLSLAAVASVRAVDRDELKTALAEANLAACGLTGHTVQTADLLTDPLPDVPAAFADPGRRAAGRRFLSLADYLPPPADLLRRLPQDFPIAFKLAPGVNPDEVEAFGGEAEFVHADGELKECVLWLGGLATARRRATVLLPDGPHTLAADGPLSPAPVTPVGAVLLDPNAAVVRAGLVPLLAERLNANGTDFTVQMLTADDPPPTPFATAYRVEAVLPADAKGVAAELRKRNVGRITPLVRGSLMAADEFVKKLKLKGTEHRHLILTRAEGKQVAVVAEKVEPGTH